MGTLQRLKEYIDSKGINNKQFEKSVGFSNGSFSSQLKNNRTIGVDKLENILNIYKDIDVEWLLTGKGRMLKSKYRNIDLIKSEVSEPSVSLYNVKRNCRNQEKQLIPLYEMSASLGLNLLLSDQSLQTPIDYIKIPYAPKCDGALYIRGDSMYPVLKAGDIACCKIIPEFEDLRYGEMYIVDIEDNSDDRYLTAKYILKSDKGDGYIKLVSENKYHSEMDEHKSNIKGLALIKINIRINTIS